MKPLPFQAGDPVTGEMFFDREQILDELMTGTLSLRSGTHQDFAVVAPRRYGKSSLLKALQQDLVKEKVATAYVDCSEAFPFSLETVLEQYLQRVLLAYREVVGWRIMPSRIIDAVKGVPGAIANLITELVSKVGAEIGEFVMAWVELRERRTDIGRLFDTATEIPEKLAEKTRVPCVVILDEFQALNEFNGKLLWSLRAKIQHHRRVAYVVSGSSVGMITKMFADKHSPFFNLFLVRSLEPFTDKDARRLLEQRIALSGMEFTDQAIDDILTQTGNIPFNLQWLGLNCYFYARHVGAEVIDEELVKRAYEYGLKNIPQFERDLARLTERQQKILRQMAVYRLEKPSEIAASSQVRDVNVAKELNTLVDLGYVDKVQRGNYQIKDKVFRDWLKARFSG